MNNQATITYTLYCKFEGYGWVAYCPELAHRDDPRYKRIPKMGGPRAAVDKFLEAFLVLSPGKFELERTSPKIYQLQVKI